MLARRLRRSLLQGVTFLVSVPLMSLKINSYYTDLVTTSKKKADYLKAEIRSKISEMLSK